MEISPSASRPAGRGPAETFTGEVSVKPLFDVNDARTFSSAEVSFTPEPVSVMVELMLADPPGFAARE